MALIVLNLERRGTPLRAIQTKLHRIPQELSKLYQELFTNMAQDDMQDSLRLMRWIHFGLRPLSLRELRTAMAVDACSSSESVDHYQQTEHYVETDEAMERRVCDLSRGLAGAVQHGERRIVQFVHQSVIDFLIDEGFQLLDRSRRAATAGSFAGRSHFQISDVCIRYLASAATPGEEYNSDRTYDMHVKFPLLEYSVGYWIKHAQKCERENLRADHLVSYFDSSSLLQSWLSLYKRSMPGSAWDLHWPMAAVHIASGFNLVLALESILIQSANVNMRDGEGHTPLSIAAERGYEEIVKLLLKREDVEVDSKDTRGRSPLWWAAIRGHEAVVKLLSERDDVVVDSVDFDGRTPLSWASYWGHEGVVRLLIERGNADVNLKDLEGRTALLYADKKGYEGIVKLLEQHLSQQESENFRRDKRRRL